jgi:hypothetical protein
MAKEVLSKDELFSSLDDVASQLALLFLSLSENEINKIPYEDSWTAGQLLRHVTKSTNGMAAAMLAESKPAERDSTEKVHFLKKTFLDFLKKMKSPEFIVPENETYSKQSSIDELNQSFEKLKGNANKANLNDLVEDLPFGPTTKLELLHFVLYHTERHLHQLRKICEALKL